ncbi:MAG: OsmC family protein [Polyangiaceae bacterium]|nr:OsmC family protein [Polyangiaceae bacterium]
MRSVTVRTGEGKFQQFVLAGPHRSLADEPHDLGGDDTGPSPFDHVFAGLGACTSMTVKMYADRKGWPLSAVEVTVSGEKQGDGYHLKRSVKLVGELSDEQRERLLEIANKCPVHKMLTGKIEIESALAL